MQSASDRFFSSSPKAFCSNLPLKTKPSETGTGLHHLPLFASDDWARKSFHLLESPSDPLPISEPKLDLINLCKTRHTFATAVVQRGV